MNGKKAKALKRYAEAQTEGKSKEFTEKAYKLAKLGYKKLIKRA